MKIAVLGGGTAGFISAAHISKKFPDAELVHIFDSRIPTIGVGEGTTPRFPAWLREITGLEFNDIAEHCGATLKKGTLFDGWGEDGVPFTNRFQPTSLIGYHFNAARVVELIAPHVQAEYIDARVDALDSMPETAEITFEDGSTRSFDYVFDARGFPRNANSGGEDGAELIRMDWIPTGRALLRGLPKGRLSGATRAVARAHGWVFQIPLAGSMSCGYLFNPDLNTDEEVAADFDAFLDDEGIVDWQTRGALDFPNFLRRSLFDGRVFWIGNAASFVEPLEATSIGASILQVRSAQRWIEGHDPNARPNPAELELYNKTMRSYILCNSLFLAWHYACGSRWDTAFWRHAKQGLERARQIPEVAQYLNQMTPFIEAGRALPGLALSSYEDENEWQRDIYPLLKIYMPFGNFSELNFAQVGHGIGFYEKPEGHFEAPSLAVGI
ncbi:tryptophan 7-halogenase [Tateyamaria pelophila]|uniref:tryptophan 7-halogenase n=1 Tax=Tateyamaria pelophila TaxID=328415 RepID=UPI001CC026E7|nr:tryptophan 7-halogenase [Tateyamaria pelophila]